MNGIDENPGETHFPGARQMLSPSRKRPGEQRKKIIQNHKQREASGLFTGEQEIRTNLTRSIVGTPQNKFRLLFCSLNFAPASPITERVSGPFPQSLNASTRFCAVYGHPIKHSASPAFQNAGLAALGLNWRYLAFEVHPDDLRSSIQGAQAMNFIGINLTVPHKLLALHMVDILDQSAKSWGAVNTIRFEAKDASGTWKPLRNFTELPRKTRSHGFNTDA